MSDDPFRSGSSTVTFKFENEEAAHQFKLWLCESGEQSYWDWMTAREEEGTGSITGLTFNYYTGSHEVPVRCGRLDKQ